MIDLDKVITIAPPFEPAAIITDLCISELSIKPVIGGTINMKPVITGEIKMHICREL